MIGKIFVNKSIADNIEYACTKKDAELISTNCASENPQKIIAEMEVVAASNKKCERSSVHIIMSAPPGEYLSNEQWEACSRTALHEMQLDDHQYVSVKHADTESHEHIHIICNRVGPDGKAWNDSNDHKRLHEAMRVVENKHNLQRFEDHQKTNDGRINDAKTAVNDSVKAAKGHGLDGFKSEMKVRGYSVIENKSKTTGKVSGITIQDDQDGNRWKASRLQKGGWRKIENDLNSQQNEQKVSKKTHKTDEKLSKAAENLVKNGENSLTKSISNTKSATPTPKMPSIMKIPTLKLGGGGGDIAKKVIEALIKSANKPTITKSRGIER